MVDLGTLPGGDLSEAEGINNHGQVVGSSTSALSSISHATLWTPTHSQSEHKEGGHQSDRDEGAQQQDLARSGAEFEPPTLRPRRLSPAIVCTPTRGYRSKVSDNKDFAGEANFLSAFSAQKSHVKPQNHLTHYPATTSAWHVSFTQPDIMDI